MDALATFLPFLLFLACPAMMLFCMFGMGKLGRDRSAASGLPESLSAEERLLALRQQLQAIQSELDALEVVRHVGHGDAVANDGARQVADLPGATHAAQRPA